MNPFREVLKAYSPSVPETPGMLRLLLQIEADREDGDPQANTFANPFKEVLHRWRNYPGMGLSTVMAYFGAKVDG